MLEQFIHAPAHELTRMGIAPQSICYYEQFRPYEPHVNTDSVLHDVGHMSRVLVVGNILGQHVSRSRPIDIDAVLNAIRIHDVLRATDWDDDPEHGCRAAEWAREQKIFENRPNMN